jgi:hypothetical protein
MRRIVIAAFAAALALFAPGLPAQTTQTYKARLSPLPADAKTRAVITGIGSATAALSGTKLTVSGSFQGLVSPATAARLMEGSVTGVRGAAISDLTVTKATSGSFSGLFDLTPEQAENFRKGRMYIQIDSEKAPDGNLWGWLLP